MEESHVVLHWKRSIYSTLCKKVVELLWKSVISTVFPHCGIVFFHSNSTHSILYSDQNVEILRKIVAYLQSVEKMWNFFGNFVVSILSICKLLCKCGKLWKFYGAN